MSWDPEFEQAFSARAIAVVGVSRAGPEEVRAGSGGAVFIAALRGLGFQGRIYPINPSAGEELQGLKCYPSLRSLPEPVDLVMISVPRRALPGVLEECVATGNRNVFVYTAGFEESGTEEGRRLGQQVRGIAQRGGLRMLGPNCMGVVYVPRSGVAVWTGLAPVPGNVGFVSQSGGHAGSFSRLGPTMGVYCSKVVSIGNAYVFDGADLLEYFSTDPETEIICMYLEGVRDGRRLRELVTVTNPRKPVVIWKGGLTAQGARAARSHTASLAGEATIWGAFFRQTGAIRVDSIEEMADVALTLLKLRRPPGRRAVVISGGGGNSVAAADVCSREGLDVPLLGHEAQAVLSQMVPEAGTSVRNPIDAMMLAQHPQDLRLALQAVFADPVTDFAVLVLQAGGVTTARELTAQEVADCLVNLREEDTRGKPVIAVLNTQVPDPRAMEQVNAIRNQLLGANIPVFASLPRAVRALSRVMGYHEHLAELRGEPLAAAEGRS